MPIFSRSAFRQPLAAKVPEITLLFWVVKILTTAGGEATSDYLALGSKVVGGAVEVVLLLVGLLWQFRVRRYHALSYWYLAYAIAISGTGVADFLHLDVGIPYSGTTVLWALVLLGVFLTWYRSERTLSIHSITTTRREMYYWATVFSTFALGTALGDFTATALGFGFLASGIVFGVVILIPALLWSRLGLNSVVAFWCAYVVTRPLGASFADYLSKSHALSGLDYGNGPTAVGFTVAVALLVGYLAVRRSDIQPPRRRSPRPAPRRLSARGQAHSTSATGRAERARRLLSRSRSLRVPTCRMADSESDTTAHLRRYLQEARDAVLWKLEGASEYDVRRPLVPTGSNLLGIVKHLSFVEIGYFGDTFERPYARWTPPLDFDSDPNSDMWARADESRQDIVELYRGAWRHSDATLAELPLTAHGSVPWWPEERRRVTLGHLLVRVTAETNRHAGHLDILRELVDGSAGYLPGNENLPPSDADAVAAYRSKLEEVARSFGG